MPESDVLVLPLPNANVLERSENVSASQTPSATFPIANLWDGRGARRFIYPLNQEDEELLVEAQIVPGGGFNTWVGGAPKSWTGAVTGTGAVVQETTSPVVDGSSVELDNGASGTAQVSIDVTVIAGEELDWRVYTETSNVDTAAEVEIQCLETGDYLQSNFVWGPRQVNAGAFVQTVFGERLQGKFTVQDFDTVGGRHTATLRVRLHMDNAAASRLVHFDNFFFIPPIDLATVHSHNIERRITPRLSSADEFTLSTVEVDSSTRFDGSSHLDRTVALNGLANGRVGIFSFWIEMEAGDGVEQYVFSNTSNHFRVRRFTGNTIQIIGQNTGGSTILSMASTVTLTADGTRHHVVGVWDLPNTTGQLWIDGVADLAGGAVFTDDDIDYDGPIFTVGANSGGTAKLSAQISDLWFHGGVHRLLDARTIKLWRTASGKSAILGASGENPIGTNPHVFLANNAPTFPVNLAGAGDFAVASGALVSVIDLEKEMVPTSPAFYGSLDAVQHHRFWRLHFRGKQSGTDANSIAPGEFILGNPKKLLRNPDQDRGVRIEQIPMIIQDTNVNEPYRVRREVLPQRAYRMRFGHRNEHQKRLADEFYRRTDSGARPAVFVRDTQKTDVILGTTESNEIVETRSSVDRVTTELIFRETSHGVLTG